jgi:hypothetical protein
VTPLLVLRTACWGLMSRSSCASHSVCDRLRHRLDGDRLDGIVLPEPEPPAAVRPVSAADTTGHLALGTYDIADEPPASALANGWTLTSVVCNGVLEPFAEGTVKITLTPHQPKVHCVYTDAFSAAPVSPPPPPPTSGSSAHAGYELSDLASRYQARIPESRATRSDRLLPDQRQEPRSDAAQRGGLRRPSSWASDRSEHSQPGRGLPSGSPDHLPAGHHRPRRDHHDHDPTRSDHHRLEPRQPSRCR